MKVDTGVLAELGADDTAMCLAGGARISPLEESRVLRASGVSTVDKLPGGRGVEVGPFASWA